MAKPFTLDVRGLGALRNKIKNLPATLQKEISGEIKASTRNINAKQLRAVPVDEGGIKQSTGFKENNALETELFSSKFYTPYMEFGTKSRIQIPPELAEFASQFRGKGPGAGGFDEFFLAILAWVHRKGIAGRFSVKTRKRIGNKNSQLQEDMAAAWPIAMSILRKGVHPHPFFFQPFLDERKVLVKNIKKIIEDI